MKKGFLALLCGVFVMVSCEEDTLPQVDDSLSFQEIKVDMSDFYVETEDFEELDFNSKSHGKNCYSMKVLNEQLAANPGLYQKMYNVEKHTRQFLTYKKGNGNGNGNGGGGGGGEEPPVDDNLGVITIPVIVHIVYNTASQNVSDAQINSQIAVLNDDFRATNNDFNQVPSLFAGVAADVEINFVLDQVIRKQTSRTSFGTNDAIKFDSQGGSNVVTPGTHLNMWIGPIGGGILSSQVEAALLTVLL